jgi:hypothetical protein
MSHTITVVGRRAEELIEKHLKPRPSATKGCSTRRGRPRVGQSAAG